MWASIESVTLLAAHHPNAVRNPIKKYSILELYLYTSK
jgi:hypothetical protein